MAQDYPLVTFALFTYNQERHICTAIEGALAQDYPNLEIIISDDASSDNTWEVVSRCIAGYSGPHKLSLNRNDRNLGIGSHVNRVFEMATGKLIVVAAGDDVSMSDRVSQTVRAWTSAGRPKGLIHGQVITIDDSGSITGEARSLCNNVKSLDVYLTRGRFEPLIYGSTAAYTPDVMEFFGPITCDIEDIPLAFRALLIGELIYVDSPLIHYRVGNGSISRVLTRSDRERADKWFKMQVDRVNQHYNDYAHFCSTQHISLSARVLRKLRLLSLRYAVARLTASNSLLKNIVGLLAMPVGGGLRDRLYFIAAYFGLR